MISSTKRQRAFARRQLIDGRLVSPTGTHGSNNTYDNLGCRCEACVDAHREAKRQRQAFRVARTKGNGDVAPINGHGVSTYTNWGCRCRACMDAHTRYCRQHKRRASA